MKHEIGKLNEMYSDAERADGALFSEMRSNVLLYSSEHFKHINDRITSRLNDSTLTQEQKLKLSINHIQVIVKIYVNGLLSQAPNVHFTPANPKELADKKDADLCQAVWEDACEKINFREKRDEFAQSFVIMGEMVGFVYFDPAKGKFLGYKQKVDENGDPLFKHPKLGEVPIPVDEMGQPLEMVAGEEAQFSGDLCIDMIHPPNLKRPSNCENLNDAEWLCVEKMVPLDVAEQIIAHLPEKEFEEKKKFITESSQSTFVVLDGARNDYSHSKGQCQLRYYYFRPCPQYPEGQVIITSSTEGILFQDVLPFGIFPIITEGFDKIQTSPRSRSIIKPLRPVQVEINRLASQQAINSILFGDTKVFLQNGTKMTKGNRYDGVREYYVNGAKPDFQEGRSGVEQFASAIKDKVAEMYRLANIEMEMLDTQSSDPTSVIYRSMSQKKKYILYAQKFESFLSRLALLHTSLNKHYISDDDLIRAVGKREAINIAEFRNVDNKSLRVKAVPVTGDADDQFMKHLTLTSVLQYAQDLPKHIKAKMIKDMPFLSAEGTLDGLTIDVDNVESDILSLDRGIYRNSRPTDAHDLYIQLLTNRTKQSDFSSLPQQVQMMYDQKIKEHQQAAAQQAQQMKAMQESLIPSGPPFVKCDLYENVKGADGQLTNKVVKSVFPMAALLWLKQAMDAQGQTQAMLEGLGNQQSAIDTLMQGGLIQGGLNQQSNMQQSLQQQGMQNGPSVSMPPNLQG